MRGNPLPPPFITHSPTPGLVTSAVVSDLGSRDSPSLLNSSVQLFPFMHMIDKSVTDRIIAISPTAAYRTLKRGFVYVTPQLKLYSGELAEMADFKISLKHPVRSVMEMCLNLSTQQAVLPVLLTLIIHSKQDDEEQNHFFQVRCQVCRCVKGHRKWL